MGCDIHVVVEKKFGAKWIGMLECGGFVYYEPDETLATGYKEKPSWCFSPARERNYDLFALLAGVRGDGPEPKGLPEDASELARALYPEVDTYLHSHSWCSLEEYIQHLLASEYEPAKVLLLEKNPKLKDPYQFYFGMYAPEEDEEYRCVFCFDN